MKFSFSLSFFTRTHTLGIYSIVSLSRKPIGGLAAAAAIYFFNQIIEIDLQETVSAILLFTFFLNSIYRTKHLCSFFPLLLLFLACYFIFRGSPQPASQQNKTTTCSFSPLCSIIHCFSSCRRGLPSKLLHLH